MTYRPVSSIEVIYRGTPVGVIAYDPALAAYAFEYHAAFKGTGWELAPLSMPLSNDEPVAFPHLPLATFYGLPACIADSLPDAFGNALIDNWMAAQGISPLDITPLDRLAYLGKRAMGALEFKPALSTSDSKPSALEMRELVEAARSAVAVQLSEEGDFDHSSSNVRDEMPLSAELAQLIAVGTSAGGARAKAVVGYKPSEDRFVSGQFDLPRGYEHWLLKFDVETADKPGVARDYGRIEYAYFLMAQACGITIEPCRLYEADGRAHFMTRRFDRLPEGEKVHMQTLCAMAELDFKQRQTHDYNQLFMTIEQLGLGYETTDEAFMRMAFNVAAANNDDHTKNHSFLMDAEGLWHLAPAYDLTHAYRKGSPWVSRHLMSVNGKFENITQVDLLRVAERFSIAHPKKKLKVVLDTVKSWKDLAKKAGVSEQSILRIQKDIADFSEPLL